MVFFSLSGGAQSFYLFAGTYTGEGSKGIYVYRFNAKTGTAEWISNTDSVSNPSFLAVSSNAKYLYAVNENGGTQPGSVSAFSFDRSSGKLSYINSRPSGGDHPCYISLDKTNQWLLVANYTGGNIGVVPINKIGALEPLAQLVQHEGSSVDKSRQEKPHVHAAVFSPDGKYVFAPDLGIDKIMIYQFNASVNEPLVPSSQSSFNNTAGSGPRHMTFHPSKKWAYVIEELTGTIQAYYYKNGSLSKKQRLATHSTSYKGAKGSADIHISPDGKYLYATNRGDANTITTFSIGVDGTLRWRDYQSTGGMHPRNFMIDPTGNWLLVANRDTDNIVIFKRNKQTGKLTASGNEIKLSSPVFLMMIK